MLLVARRLDPHSKFTMHIVEKSGRIGEDPLPFAHRRRRITKLAVDRSHNEVISRYALARCNRFPLTEVMHQRDRASGSTGPKPCGGSHQLQNGACGRNRELGRTNNPSSCNRRPPGSRCSSTMSYSTKSIPLSSLSTTSMSGAPLL